MFFRVHLVFGFVDRKCISPVFFWILVHEGRPQWKIFLEIEMRAMFQSPLHYSFDTLKG
jgi:hypothetical protein